MKHRLAILTILFLCLFIGISSASAHSTEPRVEISVERTNPGAVVDLRGVSFDLDIPVTLTLLGQAVEMPLGEVITNGEGEFLHIVALPVELVEGTYYVRATSTHHYVISPPLVVWGTALIEGGGQGLRDEDDGLLAPMPTYPPGFVPGLAPGATQSVPVEVPSEPAAGFGANIWILAGLVLLVAILGFGFIRKKT